jgi:hypothetical protein
MSVYKPFTTSDVIVSPYILNKPFRYEGTQEISNSGINRFIGQNTQPSIFISGSSPTGQTDIQDSYLIYRSIRELYYYNYLSGSMGSPINQPIINSDGTIVGENYTPNGYNYLSSTINVNREFPTGSNAQIGVISIPSNLYGEFIKPTTFKWESNSTPDFIIYDDGEGNILLNSNFYSTSNSLIGNIIYEHGIIIINQELIPQDVYGNNNGYGSSIYGGFFNIMLNNLDITCSFESTITIYESQYKCTIRENEFNFSNNPTLISGSSNIGELKFFTTSSYFSPYVSTVGLYNNNKELIAVAKLSQPLPISPTTDTNIIINLDL